MTIAHSLANEPNTNKAYQDFSNAGVLPGLDLYPDVSIGEDTLRFYNDDGGFIEFSGRGFDVEEVTTDGVTTLHILAGKVEEVSYSYGFKGGVVTDLNLALFDIVYAVNENDTESLQDMIYGGDDTFTLEAGKNWVDAGAGNDHVYVGLANNVAFGGTGDDFISVAAPVINSPNALSLSNSTIAPPAYGTNRFYGEAGSDTLIGGLGNDRISGGTGNDKVYGEAGDDTLGGDGGKDYISGGAGTDMIGGGGGVDRISGGAGLDVLAGGIGADTFVFDVGFSRDQITDFRFGRGHDIIEITGRAIIQTTDALEGLMTETRAGVLIDFGTDEIFVKHATIDQLTDPGVIVFL